MNESVTQQMDKAGWSGHLPEAVALWLPPCSPLPDSMSLIQLPHTSSGTYTGTFSGLGTGDMEMNQRDQADCKVQVIVFHWVPPSTIRAGRVGPGTPACHLLSHTVWPGQAGQAARADSAKR